MDLRSFFESSKKKFAAIPKIIPSENVEEIRMEKLKKKKEVVKRGKKPKRERVVEEPEQEMDPLKLRTAFIGNVPLKVNPVQLKSFINEHCTNKVETVRLRSVPILGCAVSDAGNQKLVRKVCAIKQQYVEGRDNCNAYAVFESPAGVEEAKKLNGVQYKDKILRVDGAVNSLDSKHSVFIGNLPFDITEETIRKHFESKMKDMEDVRIVNIRVIRDQESGLGKGFGYVTFENVQGAAKALTLHESKLAKRKLRVQVCGKRFKRSNPEKKDAKPSHVGRKAIVGAARRIQGKPQTEKPVLKKHKPNKTLQVKDSKDLKVKKDTKNDTKRFINKKDKTMKKSMKSKIKKSNSNLSSKPKKPKHAARKARQAAELAAQQNK